MNGGPGRPRPADRGHGPTFALAAGLGLVVDRWLGEPPVRLHPVVWFGRGMTALEHRLYANRRTEGVAYVACGVTVGAAAGHLLQRLLGRPVGAVAATALAVGGRMLDEEARGIANRLEQGDLAGARLALRSLVGRRTEDLSEPEVVRAVIESVAENTVDAVTAALCFATVGGAPMVGAYRAINTMDAMVGHRDARYQRFGWAAARLDDAANLIPARLTAAVLMVPLLLRPPHDAVGSISRRRRSGPDPCRRRPSSVTERRAGRGGVRAPTGRGARRRQPLRGLDGRSRSTGPRSAPDPGRHPPRRGPSLPGQHHHRDGTGAAGGAHGVGQAMVSPPDTDRVWPVMKPAGSDAR